MAKKKYIGVPTYTDIHRKTIVGTCSVEGCNKHRFGYKKYCSMHRARLERTGTLEKKRESDLHRIIRQVKDVNGCWEWQGYKMKLGYGRVRFNGEKKLVHRYLYEIFYGKQDAKICICHKCDNPKCVNPLHMFAGTHKDNMQDALKKGRMKPHGKAMRPECGHRIEWGEE